MSRPTYEGSAASPPEPAGKKSAVDDEAYRARNRTHEEIRQRGAISSLNDGIEIETHGIRTRIIAWPGNGFQTESVHVLTHRPGDESPMHRYDMADEAMICLKGKGEVYLRDRWVEIEPGDIAYFPEGLERATRNPRDNDRDFVLVNSISSPQFDLYEPFGYYDKEQGVMRFEAIEEAKKAARVGNLSPENELRHNGSHPQLRAKNLQTDDIRRNGALFNVFEGAAFRGFEPAHMPDFGKAHMVLNLWPGYGVSRTGFHFAHGLPTMPTRIHSHPVVDECLILWAGKGQFYCHDRWVEAETFDCVLAPSGVRHQMKGRANPLARGWYGGGFASPPQLDLYMETQYWRDGKFDRPPFAELG